MDGADKYKMFYLKNREFSMEFNVSELQCGMNGASCLWRWMSTVAMVEATTWLVPNTEIRLEHAVA